MAKQPSKEGLLHVGVDVQPDLAQKFRTQVKQRGFILGRVLEQFLKWWVEAPEELQRQFYHASKFGVSESRMLSSEDEVRQFVADLLAEARQAESRKPAKPKS